MLIGNDSIILHSTTLNPDANNSLVRIFDAPAGPIEPDTGQPWKNFKGAVVVSEFAGVAEIQGAVRLDPRVLGPMREMARCKGIHTIWWETWEYDREKQLWFKNPKRFMRI